MARSALARLARVLARRDATRLLMSINITPKTITMLRILWIPKYLVLVGVLFRQISSLTSSSPFAAPTFTSDVLQFFNKNHISWSPAELPNFCETNNTKFIGFEESPILLHLIPTPTSLSESLPPHFCKRLTDWVAVANSNSYSKVIHLHQDVWLSKNEIVKSRLLVQLGAGSPKRIFARKTIVQRVNATFAMEFLQSNHLWGATRAKYYYGLFERCPQGNLVAVAVATFSSRRKVLRKDRIYRSHELLRYCSLRDTTVVGGISKLCKKFIQEAAPDDIVTVVDRDWGCGSGWHSMSFETVAVMDPLVMAVSPKEAGVRRHLVGAGIRNDNDMESNKSRMGLPMNVLNQLDSLTDPDEVLLELAKGNYYPVYDTGVERLLKIISWQKDEEECVKTLWEHSTPKYATTYYSNNTGIAALLHHTGAGANTPLDSARSVAAVDSWRKTSGKATSAKLIFSTPSSMDSNATVEVRERAGGGGWRTVGIVGSTKNPSIYHGVYKVDNTGAVEPTAVVSEFIKTMAVLSLVGQNLRESKKPLRFLHFGYGAGTLIRLLLHHIPNSYHVGIELDSGVVDAANQLLPSLPNVSLKVEDALDYTWHAELGEEERFDCVCIDVFDEALKVPEEFYSKRFLEQLSDNILTSTGIMVQNFHSGGKKRGMVLEKVSEAAKQVFKEACWVNSIDSKLHAGNKVLLVSKTPLQDGKDIVGIKEILSRTALVAQSQYGFDFDAFARVQSAKEISCQVRVLSKN